MKIIEKEIFTTKKGEDIDTLVVKRLTPSDPLDLIIDIFDLKPTENHTKILTYILKYKNKDVFEGTTSYVSKEANVPVRTVRSFYLILTKVGFWSRGDNYYDKDFYTISIPKKFFQNNKKVFVVQEYTTDIKILDLDNNINKNNNENRNLKVEKPTKIRELKGNYFTIK